jgi:hypothetical protein
MVRHALALGALAAPAVVAAIFSACGSEPLPQDVCSWLKDGNNCYARFADDIGTQCGYDPPPEPSDPVASGTGQFSVRDTLDICIKTGGGQVVFDPPLDVAAFPLTAVAGKILDAKAVECGSFSVANDMSFSVTINAVDRFDAGASSPDGAPLPDDITGGTFTADAPADRKIQNVTCPGGVESHVFNLEVLQKCEAFRPFVPQVQLDSSPGAPPGNGEAGIPGFVRLRVFYPPTDPLAENAAPIVVEYFNCLIPAPPHPCEDMLLNGTETDVDCGGDCPARCGDMQNCNVDDDCQSGNCGLVEGFKKCVP